MIQYIDRVFDCPDIRTQLDENRIHEAMTSAPEIDSVRVDVAARKIYVRIAGPENVPDVIRRLRNAGFPPDDSEE